MHADLSAHVLTHDGREPVMETRKNQRPAAQPEARVPQRLDKNAEGLEIHRVAVDAAAHHIAMGMRPGRVHHPARPTWKTNANVGPFSGERTPAQMSDAAALAIQIERPVIATEDGRSFDGYLARPAKGRGVPTANPNG